MTNRWKNDFDDNESFWEYLITIDSWSSGGGSKSSAGTTGISFVLNTSALTCDAHNSSKMMFFRI